MTQEYLPVSRRLTPLTNKLRIDPSCFIVDQLLAILDPVGINNRSLLKLQNAKVSDQSVRLDNHLPVFVPNCLTNKQIDQRSIPGQK